MKHASHIVKSGEPLRTGNKISHEISLTFGTLKKKIFLQPGFYRFQTRALHMHMHNHAEVHIVQTGTVTFYADKKIYTLQAGDFLAVPKDCFHRFKDCSNDAATSSFQIEADLAAPEKHSVPPQITDALFAEIKAAAISGDFSEVAVYLTFLCSRLFPREPLAAKAVTDYALQIGEFFTLGYMKNITLADLAKLLHLSERQTARLVQKHTGRTFKNELIFRRMSAAKLLIEDEHLPLTEAAQVVGYHTYSGFWKAWTEFQEAEAHHPLRSD